MERKGGEHCTEGGGTVPHRATTYLTVPPVHGGARWATLFSLPFHAMCVPLPSVQGRGVSRSKCEDINSRCVYEQENISPNIAQEGINTTSQNYAMKIGSQVSCYEFTHLQWIKSVFLDEILINVRTLISNKNYVKQKAFFTYVSNVRLLVSKNKSIVTIYYETNIFANMF